MIARLEVKVGAVGKAKPHCQYILGVGRYSKKANEVLFSASGNMPEWAKNDVVAFWQGSDDFERVNGTAYREHILSLPREFDSEQQVKMIEDWLKSSGIAEKHAYTYAIHVTTASDGKPQPHCHLMFSERLVDDIERPIEQYFKRYNKKHPERGGCKKDSKAQTLSERKADLKRLRREWGKCLTNRCHLNGLDVEINMGVTNPDFENYTMKQWFVIKRLNALIDNKLDSDKALNAELVAKPEPATVVKTNLSLSEQLEMFKAKNAEKAKTAQKAKRNDDYDFGF